MRISEKDYLILRYLKWNRQLFGHPDYQRQMNRRGDTVIHGRGTACLKNYKEDNDREDLLAVYRSLNADWPRLAPAFSFRVELVSRPFIIAVGEAGEAFASNKELCRGYIRGREFKGTLLIPHLNSSVSYILKFNDEGTALVQEDILQVGDSDCIVLYKGNGMAFATEIIYMADAATGELAPIKDRNKLNSTLDYIDNLESLLVNYICFKHFANVTEKMVTQQGSRQARKLNPDEDINETLIPVRRMDATYYTTVIRTEGYPRRGFFRMQRYKVDGEWIHRLKWIDATFVSGYTRRAKKLLEDSCPPAEGGATHPGEPRTSAGGRNNSNL